MRVCMSGCLAVLVTSFLLVACEPPAPRPAAVVPPPGTDVIERPRDRLPARSLQRLPLSFGQSVYVPVYSTVQTMTAKRSYALTANVVVRNTDPDHRIQVDSARYYNNEGALLTEYLEQALILPPLASKALVVDQLDREGGIGANFIVDWTASRSVSAPVIEAVMIGEAGTQGVAFISAGRVIKEFSGAKPTDQP